MKFLIIKSHLSDKQLSKQLNDAKGTDDFERWQMLYLIQVGGLNNAEQIGTAVGVSKHTVYQLVRAYNKRGIEGVAKKAKGGRRRSLLSLQDEVTMMKELEQKARQGQIYSAQTVRRYVEAKTACRVSDDYLWDLFKRHGWKKKKPRPQHPKADKTIQNRFKKNSPNYWKPPL